MARLSSLASVADTRAVLDRFGLSTKKSLGQHFLINDGVVERICNLAELSHTDRVVEVGPGIGTLTEALLKRSGEVVSIERDTDLIEVLKRPVRLFPIRSRSSRLMRWMCRQASFLSPRISWCLIFLMQSLPRSCSISSSASRVLRVQRSWCKLKWLIV